MKKIALLVCLGGILLSCCNASKQPSDINDTSAVATALDNWHKNAAAADFEPYFDGFDTEGIFIGTDPGELWDTAAFRAFCKPYFDKGEAWSFYAVERNIYPYKDGALAWFDELLDTWMGVCRGSGVMVKSDGQWKVKHYVLSLSIPNETMDSIIPINKDFNMAFLKKLKEGN